jgi:SAM-dependent methyltransferase
MSPEETAWREALPTEIGYWDAVIRSGGLRWPEEWRARLDPTTPLQDDFRILLREAGPSVRILDVGAGPATTIGKLWPGRNVKIVAVDPLAEQYAEMLAAHGVEAPVPTKPWRGESLDLFADIATTFDLAHARNSLDHCYDPIAVVQGMLSTVRPGGIVYLVHSTREGTKQNWQGLHRWDLAPESERSFSIRDQRGRGLVYAETANLSVDVHEAGEWFSVVIRKAGRT